ncbi:hydroxyacid dehydrogenase [Falsiroseomonas tokyonensis]|uniref:Hydroxyacid dehydrogenase n=1 Tax=Falsiroseomonas tokyonensis TaxID=430521 RepID=A0ABV7BXK9_9PROT|nr:hydroxyacid dehydrogenase [Falsiroseomonas tokyonensis]MBU8538666.1 hydroxyacid dehydrogenase [Falsiroseomonas tokyonensis]
MASEIIARPKGLLLVPPDRWAQLCPPVLAQRLAGLIDAPPAAAVWPDAEALRPVQVLVTGWGTRPLDPARLDNMPALRLIAHAAGTVKALLPAEVWQRGIQVTNAVAANAEPVARFTLAMILLAAKDVLAIREAYRRDQVRRSRAIDWNGIGQDGRVIGLVGASTIGRRVVELLRPFGLRPLLHDPTRPAAEIAALGAEPRALDDLLAEADIVSLHAPLLPATQGLLDAARLARMKPGATLINTARGGLVDQAALVEAVAAGRIKAILDTVDPEPLPRGHPLYTLPGAFVTPHVAGAMGTEVPSLASLAIEEIARWRAGAPLRHAVPPAELDSLA